MCIRYSPLSARCSQLQKPPLHPLLPLPQSSNVFGYGCDIVLGMMHVYGPWSGYHGNPDGTTNTSRVTNEEGTMGSSSDTVRSVNNRSNLELDSCLELLLLISTIARCLERLHT
ncbi:hypothetical protein AVEN_97614-1 [Araneus ventricosus]|uniref:Uncharacterized protein n=1 Tax=Araneus ventricosus TaxID=182803 RepID=A0A4Y2GEY2_ARAVE|nr:hypothetical protein AVEN_97614-1 [Araneus ventricosus]